MTIDKVAYWLDIADEDLGVAEDLYKAKRWLYVAFMCHQAIEKTLKAFGKIDILVNNAAIFIFKGLGDISMEEFNAQLRVCVDGTFLGTKCTIEELKKTHGNIVNISSVASKRSGPIDGGQAAYGTAKSAVNGFTRYCAVTYAPDGVRINAVLPGPFNTPAMEGLLKMNPHALEPIRSILPPYLAEASDIADAVLFLAGSHARCITGCELVVDNGVLTN